MEYSLLLLYMEEISHIIYKERDWCGNNRINLMEFISFILFLERTVTLMKWKHILSYNTLPNEDKQFLKNKYK